MKPQMHIRCTQKLWERTAEAQRREANEAKEAEEAKETEVTSLAL